MSAATENAKSPHSEVTRIVECECESSIVRSKQTSRDAWKPHGRVREGREGELASTPAGGRARRDHRPRKSSGGYTIHPLYISHSIQSLARARSRSRGKK